MTAYCSNCGCPLSTSDEDGLCHLCKMSIIFNEEIYPNLEDDFAC